MSNINNFNLLKLLLKDEEYITDATMIGKDELLEGGVYRFKEDENSLEYCDFFWIVLQIKGDYSRVIPGSFFYEYANESDCVLSPAFLGGGAFVSANLVCDIDNKKLGSGFMQLDDKCFKLLNHIINDYNNDKQYDAISHRWGIPTMSESDEAYKYNKKLTDYVIYSKKDNNIIEFDRSLYQKSNIWNYNNRIAAATEDAILKSMVVFIKNDGSYSENIAEYQSSSIKLPMYWEINNWDLDLSKITAVKIFDKQLNEVIGDANFDTFDNILEIVLEAGSLVENSKIEDYVIEVYLNE